jgi:glycosyltransferase involved in cell wall biosynthesis
VKVLHLSALDGQTGAGIAAARIHRGLIERGIQSRFCAAFQSIALEAAFTPHQSHWQRARQRVARNVEQWFMMRLDPNYDNVRSSGLLGHDITRILKAETPDILHLHWIGGGAFRITSLAGTRLPIVWRCPDMWGFCGEKHYEPHSENYVRPPRCGVDALLPFRDFSNYIRCRKRRAYSKLRDLTLVAPSQWLMAETRRSALLGDRPVELIPTSCDTRVFAPRNREACRELLGLTSRGPIVLVGATSMGTRWKGLDLFVEAMAKLAARYPSEQIADVQIMTFGDDPFTAPELSRRFAIRHLGRVRDPRLMAILYSAADVFVAPSRMENLANTVLESLSCGTPAIAFNIGGMPEMIEHGLSGYLAPPFDTDNLADGIAWALSQRGNDSVRAAARSKIVTEFSIDQEIGKYIALYQELLTGAAAKAPARAR